MVIDNQLYNEIKKLHTINASLQGKIILLQGKLDEESKQHKQVETMVRNIPIKLQDYEASPKNLIKDAEKVIQGVNRSVMVVVDSMGKAPQDDANVTSLVPVKAGGSSRRTRQSIKKANLLSTTKNMKKFINKVAILGSLISTTIKYLV